MADTINTLINGIESSKSDIADAIGNKGVTVPSGTKLAGMASLINQISTMHGPAESTDGNLAAFDGDGGDTLKDSGINMANVVTTVNNVSPTNGNVSLSDSNLTNDRYVRYDVNNQGLNSTQKSNARTNIGAGTSNFTGYTASDKLSTDYINNVAGWTTNIGTLTSLTVGGTSIATSGAATVNTINNDYNASTNKLATANDLPPTITITNTSGTKSVSDGTTTLTFGSNAFNSTSIPTTYIKSASSNGNTLTLTKQDNTTTTFTPTFTEQHLGDVVSVGATSGSHIAIGGTTAEPTVGVASGYSIPSTTDQTGWSAKYDKPSGGIPATDLAESYYLASNPSGYTSNEGTVIGSGLTADYFVVGGGTVNVSISTMKPTTSSTTWSASSDVNVPTMKAISNYVTGLGYQTTDTKNTAGSTNDSSHLLYLIGAQSQAANPQTYSKDSTYINANGYLVNTNGFSSQSGASSSYASVNVGANTLSYQSGSGPAAVAATSTTHGSWKISDNTGSIYLSKTGSAVSSGSAFLLFPNVGTSSAPKTLATTDDLLSNVTDGPSGTATVAGVGYYLSTKIISCGTGSQTYYNCFSCDITTDEYDALFTLLSNANKTVYQTDYSSQVSPHNATWSKTTVSIGLISTGVYTTYDCIDCGTGGPGLKLVKLDDTVYIFTYASGYNVIVYKTGTDSDVVSILFPGSTNTIATIGQLAEVDNKANQGIINTSSTQLASTKLYLVGAQTQANSVQTYSNDANFIDSSGNLNSTGLILRGTMYTKLTGSGYEANIGYNGTGGPFAMNFGQTGNVGPFKLGVGAGTDGQVYLSKTAGTTATGSSYLLFPNIGTSSNPKTIATTDLISSAEFVEVVPYNLTITFNESDLNYKTSINIYDGTTATGTPVYSYAGTSSSGSQTVSIESGHFFIVISGRSETWIGAANKTGGVGTTTVSGQYGSSPTMSGELTADGSFTCSVQYDY